jgi:RNA polymerase sigma-B factor
MDKLIFDSIDVRDDPLSADEIAVKLNLQPNAILPVMSAGLVHLGHMELQNIRAKEMESFVLPIEDKLFLSRLLYRLSGIQKDVIKMIFYDGMTQEEVANELNLSQKQVSRIKIKGLEKMKAK